MTSIAMIPCFNEERSIRDVVTRASRFVDRVIIIDDGSRDRTIVEAEAAGATVIKHEVNRGKGMAMNTAFSSARGMDWEVMVLLDGDGQHLPEDIPAILEPVRSGKADVVVGSRFLSTRSPIPGYRMLGQHVLTWVTNLGSGTKLTDCQSGFRAFSRKAVAGLEFTQADLGVVDAEIQFLLRGKDLKVTEVPISVSYEEKAKRNPVVQGFNTLFKILRLTVRHRLRRSG
ncbi:MAG: glycosyltransferase family 2 protein [Chloroflexi bacterium]|nr:glycosyltransferase family 2 protein [Chloroflexota bacterium]